MIVTILRSVGAVVAAWVLAVALLIAVEGFSAVVYPTPPDFQGTHAEMCQHVARYPHWVLAAAVPMWGFTALASTWVAGRLGNRGCALFIGVLLVAAVLFNISKLPYYPWFKIVTPLVIAVAALGGYLASARRQPTMPPS